jgi:replicative DNA helicase
VREKTLYRRLLATVQEIQRIPYEPGTVNEQIEAMHKLVLDIQVERDDQAFGFEDNVGEAVVELAENRHLISTGFVAVDRVIRGFQPGKLVVLAGRPGSGKSSIAMDMALALAKAKKEVLFFSLEMTAQELMQRAACSTARVNTTNWPTKGRPPQDEFDTLLEAAEIIQGYPITIYETVETPQKMYAIAEIKSKATGLDLIIIDNVQIMTTDPYIEKEYTRLLEISRSLKRMAIKLHKPVLLISHLSRKVDERRNHRPLLSDLRGSGTLENDADIVMGLYREDMYRRLKDPDISDDELDGAAELIIAKNRGGRTGVAKLVFRREFTTFADLAHEQPQFEEMP